MLDLRYLRVILERSILAHVTLLNLLTLVQVSLISTTVKKVLLCFLTFRISGFMSVLKTKLHRLLFEKITLIDLEEVSEFDDQTERGEFDFTLQVYQ